jgi:ATP-binding cassette, subfamily B, bacterial CvaB/MchF/RaxB
MRTVLQSESAECGLACLAMVASAHGLQVDLTELRRRFSVSLKGTTLAQVIRHAEVLGLAARPLRLDLQELGDLRTPCLLHWDLNHFVVLTRVAGDRVTIVDPARGEKRLSLNEASPHFTGVALELTPSIDFKPADLRRRIGFAELTGRIQGLPTALTQLFLLALALEVFALAAPLFNQFVIDDVVVSGDRELLDVLAVGFALLLLTQTALSVMRQWWMARLALDVNYLWATGLFSHLVRLPAVFFEKRHLGDILSRFGSLQALQHTLTTGAIGALLDGVMALLAVVILFLYSPLLATVALVAVVVYGLVRVAFFRPLRVATEERLVLSAKEQSHFVETLRAVQPLKLAGRETERRTRWQHLLADVYNRDVRTERLEILFAVSRTAITGAATLAVFYLGARQVLDNTLTVGMLVAFATYQATFTSRVQALIDYAFEWRMLGLHAERLADIALEPAEPEAPVETDVDRLAPCIELRDVGFRWGDGEPWVLRHVSMRIEAGESVVIVGPSGCGKSTLARIILGVLPPTEGEVCIDGVPIRQLGTRAYRRLVAAVLQDDHLLAGSIAENIAFFDDAPDDRRIETVARQAAIHDEIHAMPMGYQTLVGDLGTSLSGGQKQRVLLARALYKQPKILVLDEATSHLDIDNERRVTHAIAQLPLTRIVIAHRPETIAGAGRVIDLAARRVRALATDAAALA